MSNKKSTESYRMEIFDFSNFDKSMPKQPEQRMFEIWLGYYHFGQGHHPPSKPEKVGEHAAISFKVACMKHELLERFKFIEKCESVDNNWLGEKDILKTGLKFGMDLDTCTQPWIGKYYPTREEALKSFK